MSGERIVLTQTKSALKKALIDFENYTFRSRDCIDQANLFSEDVFQREIMAVIKANLH